MKEVHDGSQQFFFFLPAHTLFDLTALGSEKNLCFNVFYDIILMVIDVISCIVKSVLKWTQVQSADFWQNFVIYIYLNVTFAVSNMLWQVRQVNGQANDSLTSGHYSLIYIVFLRLLSLIDLHFSFVSAYNSVSSQGLYSLKMLSKF